jgi:predicted nuclease with TOPRIM domain
MLNNLKKKLAYLLCRECLDELEAKNQRLCELAKNLQDKCDELQKLENHAQQLEEDLKHYKDHYNQYRHIVDTIIDKQDVLEDLTEIPDAYKKTILPLLEIIKQDVVAKSVKIMDKVDYIFYVNGAL